MTELTKMVARGRSGDRLLGAVLAGGRSSRFGSDKAQALLHGTPLVHHAASLLADVADEVVVVGPGGIADMPAPGMGPLGGIAGALDHAATHGFRCVVTIACDMPSLPDGLLDALLRRGPAFCADAPVLGHWSAALGAHLLAHLQLGGDRSVRRWAESVGAIPVHAPAPIANVNTPRDLSVLARGDLIAL